MFSVLSVFPSLGKERVEEEDNSLSDGKVLQLRLLS